MADWGLHLDAKAPVGTPCRAAWMLGRGRGPVTEDGWDAGDTVNSPGRKEGLCLL